MICTHRETDESSDLRCTNIMSSTNVLVDLCLDFLFFVLTVWLNCAILYVLSCHRDIICQIVAARVSGDEILTVAYAHELPNYGIKHGLTNFAAAYCVGLLAARRHLKKLELDEVYEGVEEVDGEMFEIEEDEDRRPFTALLDLGLIRTTTGNKSFAVMKGAVDGGLHVPHNEKRFPAYTKEEGFDPEELKSRILGNHVSEYMNYLIEEDEDAYQKQFSHYIKDGIEPDDIENLYLEAHKKIREDPTAKKKVRKEVKEHKKWRKPKLTREERNENVKRKLQAHVQKQMAREADDDEVEEDSE